ncbi:malate dehydrogenase [Methanolacinia petrolearia]|uniref:malate dehydrogenase n=1 Tax=Methanolacinia petrolearia TaxID=54120 RepID=UPI003BABB53A
MTVLSILGAGKIGGEVAFLSAATGIAGEIHLFDINKPLLEAQKLDLLHTGLDITIDTDPENIRNSDIILFAAGMARNPQIKTRADLLDVNIRVASECMKCISGFDGVFIAVTNPMDALNYYLCTKGGIEREKCIGFGGQLDTARLHLFLKEKGIAPDNTAQALGEHGEFQVPIFSGLEDEVPTDLREEILIKMRGASMPVIKGKGGTVFGPAQNIVNLIRIISQDLRETVPCSCALDGEYGISSCSIGVPAVIGREGILRIEETNLDEWETNKMKEAAEHLKTLCGRF